MSKLDRLCRILLDEQDLLKKRVNLSKEKLAEFNKLWKDINQDQEDAEKLHGTEIMLKRCQELGIEDSMKLQNIKKCVNETLENIPEHCCYTHDDQRQPLEQVKEILEGKK